MAVSRRPPLKIAIAYVLAFAVLTLPLTWLWEVWAREAYGVFFAKAAGPIYRAFGLEDVPLGPRERYINYVPFIALMTLTPGFSLKRRLASLAAGLVVLFTSHLVLNCLDVSYRTGAGSMPTHLALVSDAMPFLVWAVIARDFVLGFATRARGDDAGAQEKLRGPSDEARGDDPPSGPTTTPDP